MALPASMFKSDRQLMQADWGASVTLHYVNGDEQVITATRGALSLHDLPQLAGVRDEFACTFALVTDDATGTLEDGCRIITAAGVVFRVIDVSTSSSGQTTILTCKELTA